MPLWTSKNCENMYPCWTYKEQRDQRGRIFNIKLTEMTRDTDVPQQCNGEFLLRDGPYAKLKDLENHGGHKEFVVRQSFKQVAENTKAIDLGVGITIELPVQLRQEQSLALAKDIAKLHETDRPVLWAVHGNKTVHPHMHLLFPSMGGEWVTKGADGWRVNPHSSVVFSRPGEWGNYRSIVTGLINEALEKAGHTGDWYPGGSKDACVLAQMERDTYDKEYKVAKEALGDFLSEWGPGVGDAVVQ